MTPTLEAPQRSIDSDWVDEAERFKWIESEKAGRDLGTPAIKNWVQLHWWGYLRARWLEHLQGKCFWIELDRNDFGLLHRIFQDEKELLDQIVDRLKLGGENLCIYLWADRQHISHDRVRPILKSLDINAHRLINKFESL
jgi:hypothetical protein